VRKIFFGTLQKLFKKHEDIYVLTGDLGYKLFDGIRSVCPDRFYNLGIAEANMVGVASGMALCGSTVYCYSIIPFLIMRAYEQIRLDVDYHDLKVRLVGVGAGFGYGMEGITHFALEDLALMTSLQNMTVVSPADQFEAGCLAEMSYKHKGPMYIRLGKTGAPPIYKKPPKIEIGKPVFLSEGKKIAIFAMGDMVYNAKEACNMLRKRGVKPTLINMHTLKPLNKKAILEVACGHEHIFSVEEHNVHGGLGSLIGDVLMENGYKGNFKKIGIPDKLVKCIGDADYLRAQHGLDPASIAGKIMDIACCVCSAQGRRMARRVGKR
jgi:transketolase